MNGIDGNLVFDIGAHRGEDSAYYLSRGYRVVAVECDPRHAGFLRDRFRTEIADRRLTLVERAIAAREGPVTFYQNRNVSVWGTTVASWAARNVAAGTAVDELTVAAITPETLFHGFGIPFYLKVDIEGLDRLVLERLSGLPQRPAYLSFESEANSFAALRDEFILLRSLGYERFKLSPQHAVTRMRLPPDSVHGLRCDYAFEEHASGPFGEDLPGPWLSEREALSEYKYAFALYDLDEALRAGIFSGSAEAFRDRFGHDAGGWYDTHARHSSVAEPLAAC